MSLDSTLLIASSGLDAVSRQLSLVSQNVANASTPGYAEEALPLSSFGAGGVGSGVRSGPAQIDVDAQLQAATWQAQSGASAAATTNSALSAIDQVAGGTSSSTTIADQLGALENQFSSLEASPSNQPGQRQVVAQAEQLVNAVGQLASAGAAQRQGAQNALVSQVNQLNQNLAGIGTLSAQIAQAQAQGQSTADLEQNRNKQMSAASNLLGIHFVPQGNGGVQAVIGGIVLLLDGTGGSTFKINPAQLSPSAPASAVPGITLGGLDVTAQLGKLGGSIGANLQLRDQALPQMQAELDEFSYALASSFNASGLALFTNGSGNVPTNGGAFTQSNYVGLAQTLQVNPAVVANPALVQQGTGGASSASGSTAVLQSVLQGAFGTLPSASTPAISGLGVSGTITARFAAPASLADFAASIGAAQAQDAATASSDAETEQATATAMQSKLSAQSGVSIDTELSHMIALQNAYSANARVLTTAQSMMQSLLAAVQP
jgi:flagellar hook-associated protein 1 FlgK